MFAKQSNNTENIIQYPVRDVNEKQTDKAKTTEEFLSRFADAWFIPTLLTKLNLTHFV